MSPATIFLIGSVAVGAAQIVDGWLLLRAAGSLSRRSMLHFALFEYAWAALCAYALTKLPVGGLFFLALAFVAYVVISFVLGSIWVARVVRDSGPPTHIPLSPIYFSVAFGVGYTFSALALLAGTSNALPFN